MSVTKLQHGYLGIIYSGLIEYTVTCYECRKNEVGHHTTKRKMEHQLRDAGWKTFYSKWTCPTCAAFIDAERRRMHAR